MPEFSSFFFLILSRLYFSSPFANYAKASVSLENKITHISIWNAKFCFLPKIYFGFFAESLIGTNRTYVAGDEEIQMPNNHRNPFHSRSRIAVAIRPKNMQLQWVKRHADVWSGHRIGIWILFQAFRSHTCAPGTISQSTPAAPAKITERRNKPAGEEHPWPEFTANILYMIRGQPLCAPRSASVLS